MHIRQSHKLRSKTAAKLIYREKVSRKKPDEDIHTHVHELQVYRIELEKQNEELFKEKRWLKSLLDLYLMPEISIKDISSYVIEECIRISESALGFFGFIYEDETLMSAHLWSEKSMKGCMIDKKPVEFPCGDAGIWAEAIRQHKPIIVNDYKSPDPRKKGLPRGHVPLTRLMSIPIIEEGKTSAIVTVANKKQDYDESDFFRLNFFLQSVWGVIKRKRAEEALRKVQAELEDRVIERSLELDKAKDRVKQEITKKISVEESLKKSETLLQKIMEHMPVGVWIVDHNGKVISGNRASQEIWGGSRHVDIEQYSKHKGWRVDTGKLIKPHEWGAARAVTKGEISLNEEIEIECFDGSHKFILQSAVPLLNEEGNVTGAIVVCQEITELKQAERKRLDDALYARSLIEASLDPLVTISSDGKIMDVNNATENATGLSREQLIGSDFADYFTEPDMARKGYQEVFSKGFVRDYPLAIRNVSGTVTKVLYNASLYRNKLGDIKGIFAAARDMTDHIKMEEAIHESETLYHQFFQNSVAGSFRTLYNPSTGDARRIDCNDAHARILGYDTREDALGLDIKDIFPSDHELKNYFGDLLKKKILRNHMLSLQHKDGKRIWVLLNASARKYMDDLIMIEGTMVDISELMDAEKKLKDINEQLGLLTTELIMTEERERRKISIDLHDHIGQTLALTKIKLESLKQMAPKDEFTIILDQIEELVNQSIQQARSLMTELSPSVLYELGFTEAIEWLCEQMEADYGLQVILSDDLKKRNIDEEVQVFLFRAVRELLLNVVKHAMAGKAYITLQTVGKNIQITVKDKGIGFDISHIADTTKETRRFGLLSIKERVKHIGGLIEIRSGRGYGTYVTLMAPRKNPKKRRYEK